MPSPTDHLSSNQTHSHQAITATQQWFEKVVLGLNLCPFAHRPARLQRIVFSVSEATTEEKLMVALLDEITALENTAVEERETSLLIIPHALDDFYDYQFFLEEANRQLKNNHWLGIFQLASFHPDYCFAGAESDDPSNLTNRSPYPIIHILRESSLTDVLENVDSPEDIPQANVERMEALSDAEIDDLFPYLSSK